MSQPTTVIHFNDSHHKGFLIEKLLEQQKANRLCDVQLHVNDRTYNAHQCVLAANSPFFDAHFQYGSKEQEITLKCENTTAFESLLTYLYTGNVVVDMNNVIELLRFANKWTLIKLQTYCIDYLQQNLRISNVFHIMDITEKFGLQKLQKTTHGFMLAHLNLIIEQEEVVNFDEDKMYAFINNRSLPLLEDIKMRVVCRWLGRNKNNQNKMFQKFVNNIQLERLNIEGFLYGFLQTEALFIENEWCKWYILNKMHQKGLLPELWLGILQTLNPKDIQEETVAKDTVQDTTSIDTLNEADNPKTDTSNEQVVDQVVEPLPDVMQESMTSNNMDVITSVESKPCKSRRLRGKRKGRPVKLRISKSKSKTNKQPLYKAEKISSTKEAVRRSSRARKQVQKVEEKKKPEEESISDNYMDFDDFSNDEIIPSPKENPKKESKSKPKNHVTNRSRSRKYTCEYCEFKANDDTSMVQHLDTVHDKEQPYTCNICEYKTKWNRHYYQHMRDHFVGPPFKCDDPSCDYTTERMQLFLYHRMKHTDEKPFTCTVCNVNFRTKHTLAIHNRVHTGERPFNCEVCGKKFATKGTLDQHSVTHSDARPYLCDTCGFSTKFQSHLIAHKRIHTGDVFYCQYQNCKYSTPKRSQLSCHMRSHLSIRHYICSVCSRAFVERSHLIRHERIHLQEKPFKCHQCDYTSARRDKLKEHEQKYHNTNSPPKNPYKARKPRKHTEEKQSEYKDLDQYKLDPNLETALKNERIMKAQVLNPQMNAIPQPMNIVTNHGTTTTYTANSAAFAGNTVSVAINTAGTQMLQQTIDTTTLDSSLPIGVVDSNNMVTFTIDPRNLGYTPANASTAMIMQPINILPNNIQPIYAPANQNSTDLQNIVTGLFTPQLNPINVIPASYN